MHVQVSCGKNYIRTPGVTSSSAEVSYRKTKTSSGGFKKGLFLLWLCHYREKRKLRNHVMPLVRTKRLIKQSIKQSMTEKMVSGPLKLKDAMLMSRRSVPYTV